MISTNFYLDTRQTKSGTPAPLKISIFHLKETAYIATGIKVLPEQWDSSAHQAKSRTIQRRADDVMYDVNSIITELTKKGKLDGLSARGIRDAVEKELNPDANIPTMFVNYFLSFAADRNKERTTEIYMATHKKILDFDANANSLTFEDIDLGWLDRFDSFLMLTSPKKNARNVHFRNIRAVFNDALKKGITLSYPFRMFQVRPEPTMKKNLHVDQLRALFNAEVKQWQQKYVDFFKICFMLIGINTEDILHVKKIVGGRIEYWRAKTDKPYSIKVEPECQVLLDKYKGEKFLLNILDTYSSTHNWTSKVDNELKTISDELGLPPISVYWCRHSWATIAAELDIPDRTIAESMGHSPKTVTNIYINFDPVKIDRANRQVLDYVLYDKKPQDMFDVIRQLNENVANIARNAN